MLTNLVQITVAYSNAVVAAMLPCVNDFAKKIDLPVPNPITTNQVARSYIVPISDNISGSVILTNGMIFSVDRHGYVENYRAVPLGQSVFDGEGDVDFIKDHIGKPNMGTNEAVAFARGVLNKLGLKPEDFGGDRNLKIEGPIKIGEGLLPFCKIEWSAENLGNNFCQVVIDMRKKSWNSSLLH